MACGEGSFAIEAAKQGFSAPRGWSRDLERLQDPSERAVLMKLAWFPEVLAACERFVPIAVEMGIRSSNNGRKPAVTIPLHKGADGFMSAKQFEKFYWPSFRKFLLGIIDAGLKPLSFAEGGYNQRLDFMAEKGDLPAGTTATSARQSSCPAGCATRPGSALRPVCGAANPPGLSRAGRATGWPYAAALP